MNSSLTTNAKEVYDRFVLLNRKEMRSSLKKGLRKALREVRKAAVSNLRASYRNTNKKNPRYNDTLQRGIRLTKIWENSNGAIVGKVLASSNKKAGSGSFRLPILEIGSKGGRKARTRNGKTLKKPRNTGVMAGKYYFRKTQEEKVGYFADTMNKAISEAVNKIND